MGGMSLKRTAYHEAGHAVMALWSRCRCQHVSIIPDKSAHSVGHISVKGKRAHLDEYNQTEPSSKDRLQAEKYILVALAGTAAERILTGRKILAGSGKDNDDAYDYIHLLVQEDAESYAYGKWLMARVENLLDTPTNWFAVEALANELLKEKYIGSKRVHQIIRKAWKESCPAITLSSLG